MSIENLAGLNKSAVQGTRQRCTKLPHNIDTGDRSKNVSAGSLFQRVSTTSKSKGELSSDSGGDLAEKTEAMDFEVFSQEMQLLGYIRSGDDLTQIENDKQVLVFKCRNGKPHVASGTPQKLFWLLVSEHFFEPNYQKCFLLTYRTFMKPAELLIKVIETYKAVAMSDKRAIETTQRPLTRFVHAWIERHWEDFAGNAPLLAALDKFIEIIEGSERFISLGKSMRQKFVLQVCAMCFRDT